MPTPTQLIDTATRFQVQLEGLKQHQVNDFSVVFASVDSVLTSILAALRVDKLDEITRKDLRNLMSKITQAQQDLYDNQISQLIKAVPGIAKHAAEFETQALKTVMTPEGKAQVVLATESRVMSAVMNRPIQATGQVLQDMVSDWSTSSIKRTNAAVAIGYEQGLTVAQILKGITGTKALNYRDGITAVNQRSAATVVRTAVQQTAASAREATYEANSDLISGVQWVSTLDANTTSQCRSLDGQIFGLNEGPRPPIHPNCRSTTAPQIDKQFDFLDEGATRSSKDGYVDSKLTYYDWLKNQDEPFQDEVLGPTRGQLFRDGGLSTTQFSNLQLDKNFQPITLERMKQIAPLAFQKAGLTE